MHLSTRAAVTRNLTTAIVNGTITLILLLIAPLGLAAVIGNTFLVTVASFFVGVFADMVVSWLSVSSSRQNRFSAPTLNTDISYTKQSSEIQKRKGQL
jgi:hypothetical protein